jgi:hypothetical protein
MAPLTIVIHRIYNTFKSIEGGLTLHNLVSVAVSVTQHARQNVRVYPQYLMLHVIPVLKKLADDVNCNNLSGLENATLHQVIDEIVPPMLALMSQIEAGCVGIVDKIEEHCCNCSQPKWPGFCCKRKGAIASAAPPSPSTSIRTLNTLAAIAPVRASSI